MGSNPLSSTTFSTTLGVQYGNNCFFTKEEDSVCLVAMLRQIVVRGTLVDTG
jgi:hypothetical protein